jgi:hypothetical protein
MSDKRNTRPTSYDPSVPQTYMLRVQLLPDEMTQLKLQAVLKSQTQQDYASELLSRAIRRRWLKDTTD